MSMDQQLQRRIQVHRGQPLKAIKFQVYGITFDEVGAKPANIAHRAEFNLGLGPCGKNVIKLDYEVRDGLLYVSQTTDDDEFKQFVYKMTDVLGRIEATF